jgi:transposase
VDTLGLMVALIVSPADIQDRDAISTLLKQARELHPSIAKALADGGYQGEATANEVHADAGIPLEIVKRSDKVKGFKVLAKRWIVERTFGWLGRCRRLAKDFENLTRSHAAFVILAMIRLMLRRLTRPCPA